MRSKLLAGVVAGMVLLPSVLGYQYKVTVSDPTPYPADPFTGGPFSAQLRDVTTSAAIGGAFLTFCLEKSEYFTPGSTYFANISTGAIGGGGENPNEGTTGFDEISYGTAWLYDKFITDPTYAATLADQQALQNAIWWLEDELSLTDAEQAANKYIVDAKSLSAGNEYSLKNGGALGTLPVMAMNIYDGAGNPKQDQLIRVPDGGFTFALLGLGLAGLGLVARRRS